LPRRPMAEAAGAASKLLGLAFGEGEGDSFLVLRSVEPEDDPEPPCVTPWFMDELPAPFLRLSNRDMCT
jgi:hypothetical protein